MTFTQISDGSSGSLHTAWSSGHFRERREKPTLISLVVGTQCPTIKVATYYLINQVGVIQVPYRALLTETPLFSGDCIIFHWEEKSCLLALRTVLLAHLVGCGGESKFC